MLQVLPESDVITPIIETMTYTCIDYDTFRTTKIAGEDLIGKGNIVGVYNYNCLEEKPLPKGIYSADNIEICVKDYEIVIKFDGDEKYYFRGRITKELQLLQEYIIAPAPIYNFEVNYFYLADDKTFIVKFTMGMDKYKIMIDRNIKLAVIIRNNNKTYNFKLWTLVDYIAKGNINYMLKR